MSYLPNSQKNKAEIASSPAMLKVSRSRNINCRAEISPKKERMNLCFYPDNPELLETWNQNFKFQVFPDCQAKNKQIRSFDFFGEFMERQSA